MKRFTVFVFMAVLVALCASPAAFSQATATGTISGTVMDKSQSSISGAEVVVTNKATAAARTTTSNDEGAYRFDFLPAGTYTVKISKDGFSAVSQTVELLVGQTLTANASLIPGSVSQVVEVTSEAPLLDLAKTSVSQEITPTEVLEMPIVGRASLTSHI